MFTLLLLNKSHCYKQYNSTCSVYDYKPSTLLALCRCAFAAPGLLLTAAACLSSSGQGYRKLATRASDTSQCNRAIKTG